MIIAKYEIGRYLDKIGISYFATGTVTRISATGETVYNYFKCDIKQPLLDNVKKHFPNMIVLNSKPQYAPEIKHVLLCFKKGQRVKFIERV